jgi:hypothetical protein
MKNQSPKLIEGKLTFVFTFVSFWFIITHFKIEDNDPWIKSFTFVALIIVFGIYFIRELIHLLKKK